MLKLESFAIFFFISLVYSLPTETENEKFLIRSNYAENIKNYMDPSVNPCDDFHQYACGKWEDYQELESESEYITDTLNQMNLNIISSIHKMLSSGELKIDLEKQAKIFFTSCLNDEKINEYSIEKTISFISFLGSWPDLNEEWSENESDLAKVLARRIKYGQEAIINFRIEKNVFDSKLHSWYISQPTTGLTNRDDYLKPSGNHLKNLNAYRTLMLDIFKIFNIPTEKALNMTNDIINFETLLTDFIHPVDLGSDVSKLFKSTNLQSLVENYRSFDWKTYFHEIFGYSASLNQTAVITVPSLNKLIGLIYKTDKRIMLNYLAWRTLFDLCENHLLTDSLMSAYNKFKIVVSGQTLHRHTLCAYKTKMQLSFIVASMFIKSINLDPNSKEDVMRTTEGIKTEFENRLQEAQWLDSETKYKANLKLNHTIFGIGYPDFILDEEQLNEYYKELGKFDEDQFLQNFILTLKFTQKKIFDQLNQPVDINLWPGVITEVDVMFKNPINSILIPSGILQLPVYHKYLPQVAKYGNLGFLIGRELTHGFDNTGKRFDYEGNLRSWWTEKSEKGFREKSNCFVNQYNNYSLHGQHLSGSLTLGENIADNEAIRLAYDLYKKWLRTATPDELLDEKLPNLDDISSEKLFFIGIAQLMCSSKIKPEVVADLLQDTFSPTQFRVRGMFQNLPEFSEVFECPVGSPMNPEERCELW